MRPSNRTLFIGDNLPCLRGMAAGCVDLIATDPPFNKAREFHAMKRSLDAGAKFQDKWAWDEIIDQERVRAMTAGGWVGIAEVIDSARQANSDGLGAYLCFMAVRLIEMHRVLKTSGSLYLHCDESASHYLKALLDAVFGRDNFRNEIVWSYAGGGMPKRDFGRKHDYILRYAKSASYTFNMQYRPYSSRASGRHSDGSLFDFKRGARMTAVWSDISPVNTHAHERTGWPTQKPLPLYERIIKASSNPGDVVLDPFCGSGTTCVAAEKLGRKWVGMELWPGAGKTLEKRLDDLACSTCKTAVKLRVMNASPEQARAISRKANQSAGS